MIIGLDVSTSITGISVLDKHGELLHYDYWDTRNKKRFPSLWHKADFIESKLRDLKETRNFIIEKVYIEKNLQMFAAGRSSASTLFTIAKFNGVVSYLCHKIFGIQPEYISAQSARKACGIKVPRGENAKEVVLKEVLRTEPKFKIRYTSKGNAKPGTYDMADSIVVARAGLADWSNIK